MFTLVNGAVVVHPAFARDTTEPQAAEDGLEEIVVTGWKRSLHDSMEIRRKAIGVVDAISARDIDSFPDTNLGEALQRITGISIERRNGEGATVTARGFGPDFNLVTLNGRQLASADGFPGDVGNGGARVNTRSFNFANLATEGVQSLDVHKTGEAAASTGGIGAIIDIRTVRPLDTQGTTLSLEAQAIADESQISGDSLTPQLSGIFSWTDEQRRWGVSLAADYQKRSMGAPDAYVTNWYIKQWHGSPADLDANAQNLFLYVNNNGTPDRSDDFIDATVTHAPSDGQYYGMPSDIRYSVSDRHKERINGLLTMQFAPSDSLIFTVDYLYARAHLEEDRSEQTNWWSGAGFNQLVFDADPGVATPVLMSEFTGPKDFGFDQQHREQRNQLDALGFNAQYKASERLTLSLDLSSSKASSLPDDPLTGGNNTDFSVAGFVPSQGSCTRPQQCTNFWIQRAIFNDGLPLSLRSLYATNLDAYAGIHGNPDYAFDASTLGTQVLRISYTGQHGEARQARLDGKLEFEDSGLDFGFEAREVETRYRRSMAYMPLGDWSVSDVGQVQSIESMLEPFDITREFDDFSVNEVATHGFRADANTLAQWAVTPTASGGAGYGAWGTPGVPFGELHYNPNFGENRAVTEGTRAVYLQLNLATSFMGKPSRVRAGLRYERTDVDSTANLELPLSLVWTEGGSFFVPNADEFTDYAESAGYHNLLPSFDFDVDLTPTLKARVGWGRSIARAPYELLASGAISVLAPGGTTLNDGRGSAIAENPGLLPLESQNLDLALEWYFADDGYLAATLWDKRVSGFAVAEERKSALYDLRDPTGGSRAIAARAELQGRGFISNDAALFTMVAMSEHPDGITDDQGVFWPGGAAAYDGSDAQRLAWAKAVDVVAAPDDPLYVFDVARPVNGRDAHIYGWELAAQYFFGGSGFGVQANYTRVQGDIAYDNTADPSVQQFVLPGLGDTANAALIYEHAGLSARLAWNWRAEYLQAANVDDWHNPKYIESYAQVDMSIGYDFNEHLKVSLDGINLAGEDVRIHGRSRKQLWTLEEQDARYSLGVRYRF